LPEIRWLLLSGFEGEAMTRTKTRRLISYDYFNAFSQLGYEFFTNEALGQKEVQRTINNQIFERKQLTEDVEAEIKAGLFDMGYTDWTTIDIMVKTQANKNRYHPVKQYLASCGYDGGQYIRKLSDCFYTADGLFALWIRKWLIAAVAKVCNGAQCPVLVLDGPQGIGKSLFARWLCSDTDVKNYFCEGAINPDSKDAKILLTKKWIWEVSELGSTTRRADVEALKSFLTMSEVTEREAYGKYSITRPALSCCIGTVNDASIGVLADPSGTRRFLVSHVEKIDWDYRNQITPKQIWGEAYAAYLSGESWELNDDERKLSESNNEKYKIENPVEIALLEYYEIDPKQTSWFISTQKITETLKEHGVRVSNDMALQKAIAEALKGLGLKKYRQGRNKISGYLGIRLVIP
jgi:predicted P-loop ATPase